MTSTDTADLVARLRIGAHVQNDPLLREAAEAIEGLTSESSICGCRGTCNPFVAPCGAEFCTLEEMEDHSRRECQLTKSPMEPPP